VARLPQVTGSRLVRALEAVGWHVHHQKGSHVVLKNPERPERRIVVPCHGSKKLKKGTLHGILKDAGLSGDELRNLL
jgi:predicted RNA binding protein YcfA (HicA-like mRNA interferase family)